ncbi:unnamed protein product [Leptosia nina]|uniref:Ribosomal protein S14 n=1 Tax=Leptosia nina TaxID=320188 RepID=A0AAV1J0W4_9NEOP
MSRRRHKRIYAERAKIKGASTAHLPRPLSRRHKVTRVRRGARLLPGEIDSKDFYLATFNGPISSKNVKGMIRLYLCIG